MGHGRNARLVPSRIGGPDIPDIIPKVQVQIVVPSNKRQRAIDAITRGARLGTIGDGKIFVSPVELALSIRSGWRDEDALEVLSAPSEAAE